MLNSIAALWLFPSSFLGLGLDVPPPFPQVPSVAPDGSTIVFSSAGDLWAVSASGGIAQRLTAHAALEYASAFSPDGTQLAFESDRTGERQLFVARFVSADGLFVLGEPRQVTFGDRDKSLCAFSADGSELWFASGHEPSAARGTRLYRTSLGGGPVTPLLDCFGADAKPLPDGSGLVFVRGRGTPERPKYRGSGTSSLWRFDFASGVFAPLEASLANDHAPQPLANGALLFLSTRDGSNDLWRSSLAGGLEPLFAPRAGDADLTLAHGLRDLATSANAALAVACLWDDLVTVDLRSGEARVLAIDMGAALERDPLLVVDASRDAVHCALSPDGKTMAVVARGEVFVRAVAEGRPTRRVTNDVDRADDLAFAPDGSALYFTSDGPAGYVLWRATVRTTRADLAPQEPEVDGDEGADLETDGASTEVPPGAPESEPAAEPATEPAAALEPQEVAPDTAEAAEQSATEPEEQKIDHGARFEDALEFDLEIVFRSRGTLSRPRLSPNGEYVAVFEGRGDLVLVETATKSARSRLQNWNEAELTWLADSRHVVLAFEDTDYNCDVYLLDTASDEPPFNLTRHPDLDLRPAISADGKVLAFASDRAGENFEYDVYSLTLDRALDALQPFELVEHFEKAKKDVEWPKASDAPKELSFDLDEAWRRARRLTSLPGSETNVLVSPGGDRVLFSGSVGEESGLWSVDHRGEDRELVATGAMSDVRLSPDGERVTFVQSGQAKHVGLGGGKVETVAIDARLRVPIAGEQSQKFREAAHVVGERFYHNDLKGLDWDGLTERYAELAANTRTSQELNRVANLLFGELEGSHLAMSGGPSFDGPGASTGHLGVFVEPAPGGFRITRVLPDAPAAIGERALIVGDMVTAVDGAVCAADGALPTADFATFFEARRDQEVLLDVTRASGVLERLLLRTVPFERIVDLAYEDDVRQRRARVEELSEGRLGYLHIRGMSTPSVRDFEHDLYAAAAGKDGLVIDVRDNGGGSTADILLASLTAPRHAWTLPRGADPDTTPRDAYPRDRRLIHGYSRPIVVLVNEYSFSNAEIFAHAIKTTGRGRLVGTATFGGVISTGGTTLVDGTRVRLPFRGWFLPDGTDMENHGAVPDLDVPRLPGDEAAGVDMQLERATSDLLSRLPQ